MPAFPKDPALRQRRNKASTRTVLTPLDPAKVVVPPLPDSDTGWHPLTEAWWDRIWHSPMSQEWDMQGDLDGLFMLATLIDEFWEKPNASKHAEIRMARQAFGLTPLDRRRLEWSIEKAEEAQAKGARRRVTKADPRKALQSA